VGGDFTAIGGLTQTYSFASLDITTEVVDVAPVPRAHRFGLTSSPNPARMRASIRFALPAAGPMSLAIFDPAGRRVATLLDRQWMTAGQHDVTLGTAAMKAGVYFARLEFGFQVATHKVMVVR
jgi:hypothetical protein